MLPLKRMICCPNCKEALSHCIWSGVNGSFVEEIRSDGYRFSQDPYVMCPECRYVFNTDTGNNGGSTYINSKDISLQQKGSPRLLDRIKYVFFPSKKSTFEPRNSQAICGFYGNPEVYDLVIRSHNLSRIEKRTITLKLVRALEGENGLKRDSFEARYIGAIKWLIEVINEEESDDFRLVKSDLYRRVGEFDKVSKLLGGYHFKNGIQQMVADKIVEHCNEGDRQVFTISVKEIVQLSEKYGFTEKIEGNISLEDRMKLGIS